MKGEGNEIQSVWKILSVVNNCGLFFAGSESRRAGGGHCFFLSWQVVRLVVGTTPGGAYDNYARLLAPVLQKRLNCTVAVINKAGAGGFVAMNDLYEAPKKDGLTLGLAMEGTPLAQAIGVDGVRFDCRKFGWLATIYKDVRFIYVAPASPYKSIDDLRKLKPAKAATTTVTSPSGPTLILALEALGMDNVKIIAGYPGSTEVILAVRRGEADVTCQSINHALKKDALCSTPCCRGGKEGS